MTELNSEEDGEPGADWWEDVGSLEVNPDISRSRTGSTRLHINARAATGSTGYGNRARVVCHLTGFLSARGQTRDSLQSP